MKARVCAVYNGTFTSFFSKDLINTQLDIENPSEQIRALDLAASMAFSNALLTYPNPAVGCCVISKDARLLSLSAHRAKGGLHAERKAILLAARLHGAAALKGSSIVCTLEPCSRFGATPPCSDIIASCGASRLIYGAKDHTQKGANILQTAGVRVEFIPHAPSAALARQFFALRFRVFKLAIRANGSINGQISSAPLACYTHEIRTKIDALATFGATVRADLPTLDARHFSQSKAPDVVIFSRQDPSWLQNECRSAPLWQVPNRNVRVLPYSLKNLDAAGKFVLVEGGANALALAGADCEWLLLHFDRALSEQAARQIATNPAAHYALLAPLAHKLQPLALGRAKSGQFYAFYEIAKS